MLPSYILPVSQGKNDEVTYVFEPGCHLGAKLAGVHWWFKSRAHAAELTAGYYNTRERDGYAPLMEVLKKYHTHLSFTCVEMRDCEHPPEGRCSPQGSLFHFPWCRDYCQ
jgi:beta-amylase